MLVNQSAGGRTFELDRYRLNLQTRSAQNHMDVVGHDSACPNRNSRPADIVCEPVSDRLRLQAACNDGWVLQYFLGLESLPLIMLLVRDGVSIGRLRGRAEAKQFSRTDVVRPRPARIVGKPEAVHSENDMVAANHGHLQFAVKPRRAADRSGDRSAARRGFTGFVAID